jgi:Fibronectin type III-like domain
MSDAKLGLRTTRFANYSAFQRIQLAAGESRSVEFDLNLEQVSVAEKTSSDSGKLVISVGSGQPLDGTPHVEARFLRMNQVPSQ